MHTLSEKFDRGMLALAFGACLLSACSGSNPSDTSDGVSGADGMPSIVDDGAPGDNAGVGSSDTPTVGAGVDAPDPQVPLTTEVDFQITVPAYVSNALQVKLAWGDKNLSANWVGDELWSITDEFPIDTRNLLTVSFYDDNGGILLGRFETDFLTGSNASQIYTISANQFDTSNWDDDGDGISNLNELMAGTYGAAPPRVLLFSETRDFRHDSTEVALTALEELAASIDVQTDRANDSAGVFTTANLSNYDAVVWVMTSGDVLDSAEQSAFENFIRAGRGYAGIHAASFTEYDWPWYGNLVGAYFDSHPAIQTATQLVEDQTHTSTAHLSATWTRTDEWYDYRSNPRAQVNVLLSLDESSYSGATMGDDHPSAWYHDYDGGRSWYTGGGHTVESYSEPDFRAHLLGGLRYAAGL